MRIRRELLLQAVDRMTRVAEAKSPLQIDRCVAITPYEGGIVLRARNGFEWSRHQLTGEGVEGSIEAVLNASDLSSRLRSVDSSEVELVRSGATMFELRSGKIKHRLQSLALAEWSPDPELPRARDWSSVDARQLRAAIEAVLPAAAAVQSGHPSIEGVCLTPRSVVATDRARMFVAPVDTGMSADVLITTKSAKILAAIGGDAMDLHASPVRVSARTGPLIMSALRPAVDFCNWRQLIDLGVRPATHRLRVQADELRSALVAMRVADAEVMLQQEGTSLKLIADSGDADVSCNGALAGGCKLTTAYLFQALELFNGRDFIEILSGNQDGRQYPPVTLRAPDLEDHERGPLAMIMPLMRASS